MPGFSLLVGVAEDDVALLVEAVEIARQLPAASHPHLCTHGKVTGDKAASTCARCPLEQVAARDSVWAAEGGVERTRTRLPISLCAASVTGFAGSSEAVSEIGCAAVPLADGSSSFPRTSRVESMQRERGGYRCKACNGTDWNVCSKWHSGILAILNGTTFGSRHLRRFLLRP